MKNTFKNAIIFVFYNKDKVSLISLEEKNNLFAIGFS